MLRRAEILMVLLLTQMAGGCASTVGQRTHGIDNFATVEPGFFRGAQPSKGGIDALAKEGVKTIINLRDDPVSWERERAEALGICYIEIGTNAAVVSPAKIN